MYWQSEVILQVVPDFGGYTTIKEQVLPEPEQRPRLIDADLVARSLTLRQSRADRRLIRTPTINEPIEEFGWYPSPQTPT